MKKYELGRILKFNKVDWGLIDYSKGKLIAFSIKDKRKASFTVNPSKFEQIYAQSSANVISQETIDFVVEEEKQKKELLNGLKRGVKFIGTDDKEYMFLKFKGKRIVFVEGNDKYSANVEFVKSLTGKMYDNYMDYLTPVYTKKEYKSLSNIEKVKIAINYLKACYGHEDTKFEILELGNIISGEAYYHEVDKYYNLIGLQIKFKYKYNFMDDFETQVGFFPIYTGKLPDYYPVSFEESYGDLDFNENSYTNGCGDHLKYYEILIKKDEIENILSK